MACCAGQISQLTCSVELGIQIAITRASGDLDGLQPPLTTGVLCLRRKSRENRTVLWLIRLALDHLWIEVALPSGKLPADLVAEIDSVASSNVSRSTT